MIPHESPIGRRPAARRAQASRTHHLTGPRTRPSRPLPNRRKCRSHRRDTLRVDVGLSGKLNYLDPIAFSKPSSMAPQRNQVVDSLAAHVGGELQPPSDLVGLVSDLALRDQPLARLGTTITFEIAGAEVQVARRRVIDLAHPNAGIVA